MNTYTQILNVGLQAAYDALDTKNNNLLYFCTDTQKLYKGAIDFTNNMIAAATKPTIPVVGKIYFLADTETVEAYINGEWKVISYPVATSVDLTSDDMHIASAKAVYDAIQKAVGDITGGGAVIGDVNASESAAATLVVKKGDGTTKDVVIPGVATAPTWDASARKLTIPVTGQDAVEVNIGKDIFIDPIAANGYDAETQTINLYLNDGTGETEPTHIAIPAAALVDVYTGGTSNSTSVSVGEDNVIKVNLVVDPAENNAVIVTENGIKVDLSAYAKTTDVQNLVNSLQNNIDTISYTANANKAAIDKLNASATEEGSVAKQIADAIAPLTAADSALNSRVTDLEDTKETTNTNIQANTDNIAALATATTSWGSF